MPSRLIIFICLAVSGFCIFNNYAWAAPSPPRCADMNKRVSFYAFPWNGDAALGRAVATILSMQVWVTLRKSDPHIAGSDFGCGLIERISPKAPLYSNLQLSGRVQRIGHDAVVQASLKKVIANDHRIKKAETWIISYDGKSVQFDPIKDVYSFSPTQLNSTILNTYATLQTIRLCAQPRLPCNGGTIGTADLDGEIHEGDFARVKLGDGRQAWIYFPKLADGNEIVDFVAAIIRLQRGDYGGADELLEHVKSSTAGTGTRVEALLLQAVAREHSGRSGEDCIAEAAKLNPLLKSVVQARIMKTLQTATRAKNQEERQKIAAQAKLLLDNSVKLFDPDDPWFSDAMALTAVF